jgi:putative ABC transport system ATP-binding protein
MTLVKLKNARKIYRLGNMAVPALQGVDVNIEEGEFVAVWGPSGSGKSTLLNLIGAVDDPTEGEVHINGRSIQNLADDARSTLRNETIGFVFQGFNLLPVLTALENVMLPLQIQGLPSTECRNRAAARLADVGLTEFAEHRPDKLSGGQQQRTAVARALVTAPALVIADEPTANLDSETSMKLIALMRELNSRERTTFIFSTHDPRLLDQVSRRIHLIDGRIADGGDEK